VVDAMICRRTGREDERHSVSSWHTSGNLLSAELPILPHPRRHFRCRTPLTNSTTPTKAPCITAPFRSASPRTCRRNLADACRPSRACWRHRRGARPSPPFRSGGEHRTSSRGFANVGGSQWSRVKLPGSAWRSPGFTRGKRCTRHDTKTKGRSTLSPCHLHEALMSLAVLWGAVFDPAPRSAGLERCGSIRTPGGGHLSGARGLGADPRPRRAFGTRPSVSKRSVCDPHIDGSAAARGGSAGPEGGPSGNLFLIPVNSSRAARAPLATEPRRRCGTPRRVVHEGNIDRVSGEQSWPRPLRCSSPLRCVWAVCH
jgi:hypothetical protein